MPSPTTVDDAFRTFDANLRLPKGVASTARRKRDELIDVLKVAGLVKEAFGQGSFARGTMRKPLKDVDTVVVLPESLRAELYRPGGPAEIFRRFKAALVASGKFPGAQYDPEKAADHALQVVLPGCDFTFDLVPAFDVPDSEAVEIADRGEDTWERSWPRRLNRVVRERNQATDEQFIHQVRMAKTVKTAHDAELHDLPSLAIESLCYGVIKTALPHDEALAAVFTHAATSVYGVVYDPTGTDDLSAEWTAEQRQRWARALVSAARSAEQAVAYRKQGLDTAAVDLWHRVFGEDFPAAAAQSSSAALAGLAAGSISQTGRVVTSQTGQQARPVRPWSR